MRYRDPAIRWDVGIGDSLPADIPIIRAAKNGSPIYFYCLSDELLTVMTHWHDRRTVPCTGPDAGCICGVLQVSHNRYGYLAAWDDDATRLCIVEVTANAVRESRTSLDLLFESLRGRRMKLFRRGNNWNSPILVEPAIWKEPSCELPPAFDLREALSRIWHAPRKPRRG